MNKPPQKNFCRYDLSSPHIWWSPLHDPYMTLGGNTPQVQMTTVKIIHNKQMQCSLVRLNEETEQCYLGLLVPKQKQHLQMKQINISLKSIVAVRSNTLSRIRLSLFESRGKE